MSDYDRVFKPRGGYLYNPFKPIEIKNPVDTAKEYYAEANRLIYGNEDYSTKAKKILSEVGDSEIKSIKLMRTPVPDYIIELLNIVSFGDFKKKLKETEYDKLFHLGIVFDTTKGRVLVEKNEVINISKDIPENIEGYEEKNIPINRRTNLNEILKNTQQRLGDKYFKYSAYDNNCQNFILNLLKANNLGNESDYEWVKQDTEELFKTNPYLRKLSNTVTDVASRFTGRGRKVGGLIVKRNPYNDW
jgi:hypothetical protein